MLKSLNPFPGIRSFEPEENDLFFGRENQIMELLKILFDKRFVAVVGSSGCGKSSLIKAGLLPTLFKLKTKDSTDQWNQIYFRPGNSPLESLALALFETEGKDNVENIFGSPEEIVNILKSGNNGLFNIIKQQNSQQNINRLIYIDQFEEIFRYKLQKDVSISFETAAQFIGLFLKVIHQSELPVYVVVSLRSDFLGDCTQFAGLAETINNGNYLIPRMTEDDKRFAITGTIMCNEGIITERLVSRLVEDAGDSPDQLLIMQHALMRTWDYWTENRIADAPIDVSHYEAIGGIQRALSIHGEQIYNELGSDKSKHIAEKIFKALVNVGIENRGTRRPTHLSELTKLAEAKEFEVIEVIEKFREPGRSFLAPSVKEELHADTIIDISHESIMKIWDRARGWVEEETKSADFYIRLSRSAALFQLGKTGLLINPDLDLTLKWRQQNYPNQVWAMRFDPAFDRAINFLIQSKKEYDLEIKRKEDQQKRKLMLARSFALILGIASLMSIFSLIVAMNQSLRSQNSEKNAIEKEAQARESSKNAEKKSKEAISHKKIAEQQQLIAEQQKILALEQRKYAIEQQGIAMTQRKKADDAKEEALLRRKEAETARNIAVTEKRISDSLKIKALDLSEISQRLRMLAIAKALAIKSLDISKTEKSGNNLSGLLALQAYKFNRDYRGNPNDPDIFQALLKAVNDKKILFGHNDKARIIKVKDNNTFATCSDDGTIWEWDFATGKGLPVVKLRREILCFDYSPDKRFIVAGCYDGSVLLCNLNGTKPEYEVIRKYTSPVQTCVINSNSVLVTSDSKGLFEFRKLNEPASQPLLINQKSKISALNFTANGKILACGSKNGLIELYDASNFQKIKTLQSYGEGISALAFNQDETLLACANLKNEVVLWNIITGTQVLTNIRHSSQINSVAFNPANHFLASCSYDGTIKICDTENMNIEPMVIDEYDDWVYYIAFSPDGKKIIGSGNDKTVRMWTFDIFDLMAKMKLTRNLSNVEWMQYIGIDINYQKTVPELP